MLFRSRAYRSACQNGANFPMFMRYIEVRNINSYKELIDTLATEEDLPEAGDCQMLETATTTLAPALIAYLKDRKEENRE